MKKWIAVLLVVLAVCSLSACTKGKVILHCDRCGKEVEFPADTNMNEDWIIVCPECLAKDK